MKRVCVAVLTALLASCTAASRRGVADAPPPGAPSPGAPSLGARGLESLPSPGKYRIDGGSSELRVLVYRGGSLAQFGHNHVLVNRRLSGSVLVGESLPTSSFSFSAPVDMFVVDGAEARREEGADFPGDVSDEAKAGTLHNMLGASQLKAAQYPDLVVKSIAIENSWGAPLASLAVTVAGHDSIVSAPFWLQSDTGRLIATANFELRQSTVGVAAFSLLGGALQVRDAIQIKIKIVAVE